MADDNDLPTPPPVPLAGELQPPGPAPIAPPVLSPELVQARQEADRERRFRVAAQKQVNRLSEENMVLSAQLEEAVEHIRRLEAQAQPQA